MKTERDGDFTKVAVRYELVFLKWHIWMGREPDERNKKRVIGNIDFAVTSEAAVETEQERIKGDGESSTSRLRCWLGVMWSSRAGTW